MPLSAPATACCASARRRGAMAGCATPDEVRSVNVTARRPDDRHRHVGRHAALVARRRRRAAGALLATRDGRWVVWTPEGYFDAGAGADRLVGWTVNRADGVGADHFSLNRFRERFNRPDLIDRVLPTRRRSPPSSRASSPRRPQRPDRRQPSSPTGHRHRRPGAGVARQREPADSGRGPGQWRGRGGSSR